MLTSRTHTYNNGFPLIKNLLRCVIQEKCYSISFTAYGGYKIHFIDIVKSRKEIVDIPENVMYIFSALIATFTDVNCQRKHFFQIVRLNFPGFKAAISDF